MLLQSKNLINTAVISLHTGHPVGQLQEPIIDPHKLEVVGFYVGGQWTENHTEQLILLTSDIRDLNPKRAMINSLDELASKSDLHRLKDILQIKYEIIQKGVRTEGGKRLGKVDDFVIDNTSFEIQKLYVRQSLFKSVSDHSLIVDRTQIVEVNDKNVIVAETTTTETVTASQQQPAA